MQSAIDQRNRDHLIAYLVSLGLGIRLQVTMLDEPVSDLRVVPSGPDGRLGSGVVLIEQLLVLLLLELSSVVGATASQLALLRRECKTSQLT